MRPTPTVLTLLLATVSCTHGASVSAPASPRVHLVADGHIDVPYRLREKLSPEGRPTEDISQRTAGGDFDYPRAVAGGLGLAFMSIYVPAELQDTPGAARKLADELIDMMEGIVRASPDKFALARSVTDVRRDQVPGRVFFTFGIENGAALEDSLENVAHFHQRGVRYITLAHSKDNLLSDSSYATDAHRWNGLSPLGRQVVAEMNRVGIMVDVAHLSDEAILQAVETSRVPVIASHSSCRHFTPGFQRNLSDALIRAVAAKGGVVMINFGSDFLTPAANAYGQQLNKTLRPIAEQRGLKAGSPELLALLEEYRREHPFPLARVEDVADHIEHVVKLVGIDHVGFGSDFDGVGPTLPVGLQDVSQYPNLLRVLRERGYTEADLEKVASGNVFRVWKDVEAHAARR